MIKCRKEVVMAVLLSPPTPNQVTPDARKKYKRLGIGMGVCIATFVAAFVSFAAIGFSAVATFGEVSMAYIAIPFGLFLVAMVMFSTFASKRARMGGLIALLDKIENADHTVILSLNPTAGEGNAASTVAVVKKCIEVGLLSDYEVVADVVVAKKSLAMSDEDATAAYDAYIAVAMPNTALVEMLREKSSPAFCSSCGAPVENSSSKYCQYCGAKLRGEK